MIYIPFLLVGGFIYFVNTFIGNKLSQAATEQQLYNDYLANNRLLLRQKSRELELFLKKKNYNGFYDSAKYLENNNYNFIGENWAFINGSLYEVKPENVESLKILLAKHK